MFYIMNFRKHDFFVEETVDAVKNTMARICYNTETTLGDMEVINLCSDEIRCSGEDFMAKGEEAFS